ncbi:hypothetical protein LJC07_05330 [Christensenellaceae bacterium OttesenSCG-928-L17]|nr:hypothetical protein [Christensenellaceae bacterium OttesenSCG-928-L17]
MKHCLLDENKICNDCLECERCDLNPDKLCDNCCKCIEGDEESRSISVLDIVMENESEYLHSFFQEEPEADETSVPTEEIEPTLLAYWEEKLRTTEEEEE